MPRSGHRDLPAPGREPARRDGPGGEDPTDDQAHRVMLVLGRKELERLLPPAAVIRAVESAFARYARGEATVPSRLALTAEEGGLLLLMPSALAGTAPGAKLVSVCPKNPARGLPPIFATYVLLEPGP